MRLYVPTGGVPRILEEEAVLNGYKVPAGVSTLISIIPTF